jgi:uncharacterized protein
MNNIKTKILKYPVISAIIIMLIGAFLTEIHLEDNLFSGMPEQYASYLTGVITQGGVSLLMIWLLKWLGLLKQAGFTKPKEWKQLWVNWLLLVYCLLNIDFSVFDGTNPIRWNEPGLLVLFVLLFMAVGFVEEILFRGVMLPLMLRKWGNSRKGIYWTVIFSSAVFGLVHIFNLMMGRRTLMGTIPQIVYAIFFGVYFAACFLRNRSIWPVIFTHALFDLCGNFTEIAVNSDFGVRIDATWQSFGFTVLFTLPLFIYGLILLRKVQPEQWREVLVE